MMEFGIGGIFVAALVFGIVEAAKEFGLKGKPLRVLVLILGFAFVGLAQAITQELIPALWVPWIVWVVTALAGGIAAMGYFDFSTSIVNQLTESRKSNISGTAIPNILDGVPITWPSQHHGANPRPREPATDSSDPQ